MLDPEIARLADAMYEANPALRALSTAHVTESVEVASTALATRPGLPR